MRSNLNKVTLLFFALSFGACKKEVVPMYTSGYYYQPSKTENFTINMIDDTSTIPETNNKTKSPSTSQLSEETFLKNIVLYKTSLDGSKIEIETANYKYDDKDRVIHTEGKYEIKYTTDTKLVHRYITEISYSPTKITETITKKYGIESRSINKYNQEYFLDTKGRVIEYVQRTNLGEVNFRYLYIYDQHGYLTQVKRVGTTNRDVVHQIMDLVYKDGNLTEIKITDITYDNRKLVSYIYYKYSNKALVNQDEIGQAMNFGIPMRFNEEGNSIFGKRLNVNIIDEISRTGTGAQNSPTLIGEEKAEDYNSRNIYQYTNSPDDFITSLIYNRYNFNYTYFRKVEKDGIEI